MTRKVIMIMGVQRSGTDTLFHSFAKDKSLAAHNEAHDSPYFENVMLRPKDVAIPLVRKEDKNILLKPISETKVRSVVDVIEEYAEFDVQIVWIYRNPVNVCYSSLEKWGHLDSEEYIHSYTDKNLVGRNQMLICSATITFPI